MIFELKNKTKNGPLKKNCEGRGSMGRGQKINSVSRCWGLVEATYFQMESCIQEMDEIREGEYVWRDEG